MSKLESSKAIVPTCSLGCGWGRLFVEAYAPTVPLAEGVG